MIKLRIQGTKNDIRWFMRILEADGRYKVENRDLVVNKSQILDYTGGANYITGFAVRMPDGSGMDEFE